MIPKEVKDSVIYLTEMAFGGTVAYPHVEEANKIISNFLETTDRYIRDLEQHVDDLVAGQRGCEDWELG